MSDRVTSSVFNEGFVRGHYGTEYAVTWDHPADSIDHHLQVLVKNNPHQQHPDIDFLLEVRASSAVRLQQALCEAVDAVPDRLLSDEGRAYRAARRVRSRSSDERGQG